MTKQKTSKQEELPIKVTSNIPAVVADGHGLAVNNDNGSTNLMFIQITTTNEEASAREAAVVSNVRLSFDQLKSLGEAVSQAITEYEANSKKE